jgi:ubiquinone/menaquinone biosynthesis C-methylase UbiE
MMRMTPSPSDIRAYYEARAPEYDDAFLGQGLFAGEPRPGFDDEVRQLASTLAELGPSRTVDVACGTGLLTRHLEGVVGVDYSPTMLRIAQSRIPRAQLVRADGMALPFANRSFDRLVTGHFYGHLFPSERGKFLAEARRVAMELVVFEERLRDDLEPESLEERELSDGSSHRVYKRYFTGAQLVEELGGGKILFEGHWFVCVRTLG